MKAKRQAEFLVQGSFPWTAVEGIGVKTPTMAARVEALLPGGTARVTVQRSWYY